MDVSILDVLGPVMIGPSSSHTAGALRLARAARAIYGKPFDRVVFELHGSFARTGVGHGTDRALLAGVLGLQATDPRIRDSYALADARGLSFSFRESDLGEVHENTCRITFYEDGGGFCVTGCSVGGGSITVMDINGTTVDISGDLPTLVVRQQDRKGVLSAVTSLLAARDINIGVLRLSRDAKGATATTVIETDNALPADIRAALLALPNILDVTIIDLDAEATDV
ncbi:MAG: L-serine ammonia-lyase, iron-sulfur-dependent subunit beta [Oscillospiraceae bacterium]|nr:L-serine ammonia-lyase, iron-sulfur-dependent subunit beta [Oscillospiraceae bacterium]